MASASSSGLGHPAHQAATGSTVLLLMRLEGLAVAVLSALLYGREGSNWWLFAALWLAPDISMLGYLTGQPCWGARIYNAFHTYVVPGVLAVVALVLHKSLMIHVALIWINHIGVDRFLGFGLKYSDGFGFTHLGQLGGGRR
jgi:hypothetical protein